MFIIHMMSDPYRKQLGSSSSDRRSPCRSDWDVLQGALLSGASPFIVNLAGGDVPVTEQFLHLPDIDDGIEKQGSGGRRRECVL